MRQRVLGRTGLSVSELALGTWGLAGQAYGPVPEGEARRVIERARAMGIGLFETSTSYGAGRMEHELGEVLAGDGDALVVTKWGTDESSSPPKKDFATDFLERTADASLGRLGAGTRVVALLHGPSARALREGVAIERLRAWTASGRLASWGVSAGDREVAAAALEAGAPIVSLPYNILHVEPVRGLRERFTTSQAGLLVHSVLGYGLLTGRWSASKEFPASDHRSERWPDDSLRARLRHLDGVRPLVSGDVPSLRAAALRFALQPEFVSSVVLGPKSTAQLDQLVRDAQVDPPYLSEQKLSGLEGRLSHLGLPR